MKIATSNFPKRRWLVQAMAVLLAASALTVAPHAQARVFISVNIAPPLLPIYEQPPIPGPRYMWTPGFWAYDYAYGYYWVPGTWVLAPYVGALWTPGYWGWNENAYAFYPGYWGPSVGYYGGIDYGYGYNGDGYYGGYWNHDTFYYNTTVNRIGGVRIANVYSKPVVDNNIVNRFSFNGPKGVLRQPTRAELAVSRQRHTGPVSTQIRQQTLASHNKLLRASMNNGTPPITATPRAGVFPRVGATSAATIAAAATSNRPKLPAVMRAAAQRTTRGAGARTSPTRISRESVVTRSTVRHQQTVTRSNVNTRFTSHGPSGPSMHQARQVDRSAGPSMHVMHSEGPRSAPGVRMQPRQASGPRGGDKRTSGGDKPKDRGGR